ncbi:MAG TPA: biotin/lipoyl-containing protein, partial [Candidatus Dormibacteraeota bacterium]|nr:biotin/lipoyl-containing protein [Candidatus Dormibacteraeota bacterium]
MPIEIKVPRLGWSMEEGGFVGWLKKSGDAVKAGEPLFILEGDKATQDVEATDGGVLYIPPEAPAPGSPVVVGRLLGYLLRPGERPPAPQESSALSAIAPAVPTAKPAPEPSSSSAAADLPSPLSRAAPKSATSSLSAQSDRRSISPRALRTAMELGVDWTVLRGSGRSGRIREKDVLAAAAQPGQKESPKPMEARRPQQPARALLPAHVPGGTIVITDWTFADLAIEEHILK